MRGADQFFRLLKCDCINGYGIARKRVNGRISEDLCIVVYVNQKLPVRRLPFVNRIPESIRIPDDRAPGGIIELHTDVAEARFTAVQNTVRVRPAPGGVSIGHEDITAGTLGGLVFDQDTNARVILSNNHVLANTNQGAAGDAILQPGPADGGTLADRIATLTRWVQIDFSDAGENLVDAAIATPVDQADVTWDTLHIGPQTPSVIRILGGSDLGLPVQKTGRTTDHTTGFVQAIHATVRVKYDLFEKANFIDQIILSQPLGEEFSGPGDSGSLIYDSDARCLGLLFAGSEGTPTEPGTTIANPIRAVFRSLHLRTLESVR